MSSQVRALPEPRVSLGSHSGFSPPFLFLIFPSMFSSHHIQLNPDPLPTNPWEQLNLPRRALDPPGVEQLPGFHHPRGFSSLGNPRFLGKNSQDWAQAGEALSVYFSFSCWLIFGSYFFKNSGSVLVFPSKTRVPKEWVLEIINARNDKCYH